MARSPARERDQRTGWSRVDGGAGQGHPGTRRREVGRPRREYRRERRSTAMIIPPSPAHLAAESPVCRHDRQLAQLGGSCGRAAPCSVRRKIGSLPGSRGRPSNRVILSGSLTFVRDALRDTQLASAGVVSSYQGWFRLRLLLLVGARWEVSEFSHNPSGRGFSPTRPTAGRLTHVRPNSVSDLRQTLLLRPAQRRTERSGVNRTLGSPERGSRPRGCGRPAKGRRCRRNGRPLRRR